MLLAPIKKLSEVSGQITRGLAALERGVALIHNSPVEPAGSHAPGPARGEIELRDVSVRYRDDQPPALDRLNLHVHHGETVALVGPSGAGKSTLVHLLPRFVDPSSGSVLLDGVPLGDWQVDALRQQFALVSQDVVLFNDSIAANVALGLPPDATLDRERVREALRGANLLDFVEGLPQGLDTPIGHNGNQLSGGQRQRLAIARAIYKDAPILILDEATSALDSESERAVQDALDRLDEGPHLAGHRAPPVHHRTCRPRGGDGSRPRRRTGHARRTAGPRRPVCQTPHHAVRRQAGGRKGMSLRCSPKGDTEVATKTHNCAKRSWRRRQFRSTKYGGFP